MFRPLRVDINVKISDWRLATPEEAPAHLIIPCFSLGFLTWC